MVPVRTAVDDQQAAVPVAYLIRWESFGAVGLLTQSSQVRLRTGGSGRAGTLLATWAGDADMVKEGGFTLCRTVSPTRSAPRNCAAGCCTPGRRRPHGSERTPMPRRTTRSAATGTAPWWSWPRTRRTPRHAGEWRAGFG